MSPTAADYIAAGLKLVAIPRGSKAPRDDGWNLEKNAVRTIEQAELLNGCNIGIAHLWSGTCAIDVDDYLAAATWLAARGIHLDVLLGAGDAVQISSGRENRAKLVYRLPDGVIYLPTLDLRKSHGIDLELRCAAKDGTVTVTDVLPPSIHELTHKPYVWAGLGDWRDPPELPAELLALWRELARNGTKKAAGHSENGPIWEGGRNNHLTSLAGTMRRRGISKAGIYAALMAENQAFCVPPLSEVDVARIARSVSRYAPEACEEPPIGEEPAAAGEGNGKDAEEWPEPGHISHELLPVPAFDPDVLLSEPLRGWIVDQAEGMPCPVEFVAVPALVMAGSVIGARCGIRPKVHSHWVSIPNLWGGIVGAPGSMKSPAIYAASRPLARVIKAAKMAHAEAMKEYKARQKALAEEAGEGDEEDPPIEKRYKTNDCTIEKLADLLIENPSGLLVQRDELVGLIASWDMKGHEQARAFYLESWNGYEDKDVDRIKRGSSYVPILCLSVFGGIQPARLASYLNQARDALANDGMLQRFQLLVYPDPVRWENVDRKPNTASLERAYGVFEALAERVPEHWGAVTNQFIKFPYFVFEDAAQAAFDEWQTELHRNRIPAEDDPLIAQYLSKLDNLFLGLALIFHLIDIADTQIPMPGQSIAEAAYVPPWAGWVRLSAVQRAKAWCDHLEAHARRVYGMMASEGLRAARALADKVRGGKLEDGFTVRDVLRKRWHGLTEASDVGAALAWLEEEGWLRGGIGGTGPSGGRPTARYRVNPHIRAAAR